jgi:hypothetical protein
LASPPLIAGYLAETENQMGRVQCYLDFNEVGNNEYQYFKDLAECPIGSIGSNLCTSLHCVNHRFLSLHWARASTCYYICLIRAVVPRHVAYRHNRNGYTSRSIMQLDLCIGLKLSPLCRIRKTWILAFDLRRHVLNSLKFAPIILINFVPSC